MENAHKQRRSFADVHRKSLLFDEISRTGDDISLNKEISNVTTDKYLTSLKEEITQWKELLKRRNEELKYVKNEYNSETMKISALEVAPFLSEEDKIFLTSKPDYLNMMECASNYLKAIDFLRRYKEDVIEYYNDIIEEVETATNSLVDCLNQSDNCELCNERHCINSDHKFSLN